MPARATLPLYHALELSRPLLPLRALAGLPHPFLLHSALPDGSDVEPRRARWSFFGADPFALFRDGDHESAIETWRRISARAPHTPNERAPGVPFAGGAVGYWAYDYGRRLEKLSTHAVDDLKLPDFVLGFYDVIGAYDHETQQTWLISSGLPLEGEAAVTRARERLEQFRARVLGPGRAPASYQRASEHPQVHGTFNADTWRRAVLAVQDHIRRGDIFQANLAQRWQLEVPNSIELAPALYDALTEVSPAPYAAYFDAGDHAILSASPERFLALRGEHVETRPIKGTRPRGATPQEDERLAQELLASEKDRAENVMIVDVLRNDLGRVCEAGTVNTPGVCELERFPQVFHLTSTVTARLREDKDAFDLLHACFPGGSITGAPKIRAMEVIESIEPVRRHVYTGAIGWVGWDGDADWSVAIRTATATGSGVVFHAGGGITADSDPDAEYRETLDKAEGLRLAFSRVLGEIRLDHGVTTGS
jgi:para-aminobenzoate synthetase component 1